MKKRDLILILAVLAFGVCGFFALKLLGKAPDRQVRVYLGGQLYATVPYGEETRVEVVQENGAVNVISITKDGAVMERSTCKNQVCVEQGMVKWNSAAALANENWIICLPNQVSVEIGSAEAS